MLSIAENLLRLTTEQLQIRNALHQNEKDTGEKGGGWGNWLKHKLGETQN
jgi:hypothetical protein